MITIGFNGAHRSFSLSRVSVDFAFSSAPMTDMMRSLISFARSLNFNACMHDIASRHGVASSHQKSRRNETSCQFTCSTA